MSAMDNVMVAAKTNDNETKEAAKKHLTDLGLTQREFKKRPSRLSGGQCQRVAIARAMINSPKVIFADEPTAALDHENAYRVMKILKEYSDERLVIVVTHDRSILSDVDMTVEIWDGKISAVKSNN
jgi:putative ABC transport system ATP-binding protein